MTPNCKWCIGVFFKQFSPQATDMTSHRIVFITDRILTPYFLINLPIGKNISHIHNQKAKKIKFLCHEIQFYTVMVNFSVARIDFKF